MEEKKLDIFDVLALTSIMLASMQYAFDYYKKNYIEKKSN